MKFYNEECDLQILIDLEIEYFSIMKTFVTILRFILDEKN